MTAEINIDKGKIRFGIILVIYFFLSAYFSIFQDFQYLISPDVTSYVSVAQKYLRGDFAEAINGHWSPLASWLAIPLMIMEVRPLLSFLLEAVLTGAFALAGIYLLMHEIGIRDKIRFIYTLSLSPLITLYALTEGNPDILSMCVLLFYIYLLLREEYRKTKYIGLVAGLLGAIAYLSKSYNFYFFILHFTLFNLLYFLDSKGKKERRIIVSNAISWVIIFALISSAWIGLLTDKYNEFTVSTAGDYNFSFIRPDSPGHMVNTEGMMPPQNETAYSAWEDPTYIKKVSWSPFESVEDFQYFIMNTAKNLAEYLLLLSRNPILFFTSIYFLIAFIPFRSGYLQN